MVQNNEVIVKQFVCPLEAEQHLFSYRDKDIKELSYGIYVQNLVSECLYNYDLSSIILTFLKEREITILH